MQTGLCLNPITFDWTQIAYNTNPLLSPSWAAMNVFAGLAICFWLITPIYNSTWYTAFLPLMTADVYDRYGNQYHITQVVGPDYSLDVEAYRQYSPPYLPVTFAFVYRLSFASITAVLTHTYVWHWDDLVAAFRGTTRLDIHARLMRAYKKTPWYWYVSIIVIIMAMSIAMVEVYDTQVTSIQRLLRLHHPGCLYDPLRIDPGYQER